MTPVRVAFLSSYTGLGGGETILLELFRAMDRGRIDPVLVCPRTGQLPEAAEKLGITVHIVPWKAAHTWFVPALTRFSPGASRLRKTLKEISPAVIHSDFHSLPATLAACEELGCPPVFACWGWWFRPHLWQRSLYRRGSLVTVAGSEAIKSGFLGTPPFMEPSRVEVVLPGVDTGHIRPRPEERAATRRSLGLEARAPLVTLVARFQRVKGHDVFLDAAVQLLDRHPEARFAIAGENVFGAAVDEDFKREVIARVASDSTLRDRVKLLGWIEHAELLLAASDVVVCSSRFESFGVVAVEAMASGVPVVSTNRGGPQETIVDTETGFLVPPDRPDLIAERVETLLRDEPMRRRMGEAGRARAEARFQVTRYAARMSEIFEEAAANSRLRATRR